MTTPTFGTYIEPSNGEGDRLDLRTVFGHRLIIKVHELRENVKTARSPEGIDGVVYSAVDLDAKGDDGNPAVYRNTITFSGATRDGLKAYIGKPDVLFVKVIEKKSAAGPNTYPVFEGIPDTAVAAAYYGKFGDPFAQTFTTDVEAPKAQTTQAASVPAGDPDWMN